jgi:hypothetical protein
MLIRGVDKHTRRTFKTWVEGAVPAVIFEVTSDQTLDEDRGPKHDTYARLGVAEYLLFDPEAAVLTPPLQGYRLRRKKYIAIPPAKDGSLSSEQLGLRLVAEGMLLRLIDAATGERILWSMERAAAERRRADAEKERADTFAAEVGRLKADLARLRRKKK